jgi:hypothetical protein
LTLGLVAFILNIEVVPSRTLVCVPIKWAPLIGKDSLKIKELEHVLLEKGEQLFRDLL